MKRSVLRIGCAVLSLSAAAGLLASCSLLPPASPLPDSKPARAEEAPGPAAASLDDGKLRILYSNGSNGGNTVLCGNTVLYQAASSETVYLVPDTAGGPLCGAGGAAFPAPEVPAHGHCLHGHHCTA